MYNETNEQTHCFDLLYFVRDLVYMLRQNITGQEGFSLRKIAAAVFLLLAVFVSCAAASGETIEELIAQLEGKTQEEIEQGKQEREQERDEEKFAADLEKQRQELIKKKLWGSKDAFNGTVAYRSHKTTRGTLDSRSLFFTCHDTKTGPLLICRIGYMTDKYIFLNDVQFNIDGEFHSLPLVSASAKPRYGWEYYDFIVLGQEDEEMYRKIINSKRTMVRLMGSNGVIDFEVSQNQKQALGEVMRYHHIREYQFERRSQITMEKYLEKTADLKW